MLGQLNAQYTQKFAKKCKLASKSKINVFKKILAEMCLQSEEKFFL